MPRVSRPLIQREEELRKRFPPRDDLTDRVIIDPITVVDTRGRYLCWYLPQAIAASRQVSFALLAANSGGLTGIGQSTILNATAKLNDLLARNLKQKLSCTGTSERAHSAGGSRGLQPHGGHEQDPAGEKKLVPARHAAHLYGIGEQIAPGFADFSPAWYAVGHTVRHSQFHKILH